MDGCMLCGSAASTHVVRRPSGELVRNGYDDDQPCHPMTQWLSMPTSTTMIYVEFWKDLEGWMVPKGISSAMHEGDLVLYPSSGTQMGNSPTLYLSIFIEQ